ncbi:peptide deformylase [Candidatus Acetothermia bacterium]|nr:peptide deformylase [Candidatus Acetothermia bacterium]MBI3643742.1 peptide deformylase [Candidatus Acetothermia bacterium]
MSLEVRLYPDPVLRERAKPIEKINDEIRMLADAMIVTLVHAIGYGLAAPQVGVSKRLIVVDVNNKFYVLVNPEILTFSEEKQMGPEGCLSIPGPEADVERSQKIAVRALNLDGEEVYIEAEGMLARAFQHEVDHLNGILFIDHLGRAKRQLVLREFEKHLKEESEEAVS